MPEQTELIPEVIVNALRRAKQAITVAIYHEDGLDGADGQAVLAEVQEAFIEVSNRKLANLPTVKLAREERLRSESPSPLGDREQEETSYEQVRDAIMDHLSEFCHDGEDAEESLLCDAVKAAADRIRELTSSPVSPSEALPGLSPLQRQLIAESRYAASVCADDTISHTIADLADENAKLREELAAANQLCETLHDQAFLKEGQFEELSALRGEVEELRSQLSAAREDSKRIDHVQSECLDVRCMGEPRYPAEDADVYFDVIEHHMAKPHERIIGTGRTVREAIDNSMSTPQETPSIHSSAEGQHG